MPDSLHRRPGSIQHSWVEVYFQNRWLNTEGFIVDTALLSSVKSRFSFWQGGFCGLAIGVDELAHPRMNRPGIIPTFNTRQLPLTLAFMIHRINSVPNILQIFRD